MTVFNISSIITRCESKLYLIESDLHCFVSTAIPLSYLLHEIVYVYLSVLIFLVLLLPLFYCLIHPANFNVCIFAKQIIREGIFYFHRLAASSSSITYFSIA